MRLKWKKALAMGMAAVMAAGAVTACSSGTGKTGDTTAAKTDTTTADGTASTEGGEQVTVTFWSWLPTTGQWDGMVEAFEKENPNIKIDYTRTEQSDYFEKLQVAMASGTGPDLYGMTTDSKLEQYAPFGEPMDGLADQYLPGWRDVISESAVDQCTTASGTLAGMPLLVAGMNYMLYNQSLLEECGVTEVPKTYEELKAASEKITAKGYVPMAIGAADDWVNSDWFVGISNQFEPNAVYAAEEGERSFTDQCFVDTMNAWAKLFNENIFEEGALGVATYPDARDQYFFDRKSAFFSTGSWHLGPISPTCDEIQGTAIEAAGDVIGMTMFPQMGPNEFRATTGVDIMMCVNKGSQVKEAAMKFVEFMSQGEGQQMWVNTLQGSPVSNQITYKGAVDGQLQQESIDTVNAWNNNAIGARKLKNSELEKAIVVGMQNVAAGAKAEDELKTIQQVAESTR